VTAPDGKTNWVPSPKLQAAGVTGALAIVAGWALETYAHVGVPEPVWLAAGVVVTWLAGYLKPGKARPEGDYERRMGRP
jgi:hypothetical protein